MLLLGAGLVDMKKIDEGYASVDRLGTQLHKALVLLGHVSQYKMDRVLRAESMVRDNLVATDMAIKALRMATSYQLTFDEALERLTEEHKRTNLLPSVSNEITDLLLKAGLITKEQLGRAVKVTLETGMQMGRVLVYHRDVTSSMMRAVMTCVMLMQEEKITEEAALEALELVKNRGISAEQALFELRIYAEGSGQVAKIGELFAMAGFISESDMMECLEIHILRARQLGQVFVEQGLIDHQTMENAIILQGIMGNSGVKAYQAAEALKVARATGVSVYQALGELKPPPLPPGKPLEFRELIVYSGLISRECLEVLIGSEELSAIQIAKKILAAGYLGDRMCFPALRCHSLNREGFISNESAIEVLRRCIINDISLDESLAALGHFVPNRMQWIWH